MQVALRWYEDLPGAWLLVDPWAGRELTADDDSAFNFVANAIVECVRDGHKEAMVKFTNITWDLATGVLQAEQAITAELGRYPHDPATVKASDSIIRAMSGARKGATQIADHEPGIRQRAWARRFWATNWRTTPCLFDEEIEPEATDGEPATDDQTSSLINAALERAAAEYERFLSGLFGSDDVDLYDPEKSEVIAGLVARAVRATIASLQSPHTWNGEHGSGLTRLLAETEITLAWLRANEPQSYARFQSYGQGKRKLMNVRMTNLAAALPGDPPAMLAEAIDHMDTQLGSGMAKEFVAVNLDSNFSGKSARAMADDVGLSDLYRDVFQSASAVAHGEWWTVQDYSMQRCLNPLHRFHWVPSMEPMGTTPRLAQFWLSSLTQIVSIALEHLVGDGNEAAANDT